MFLIWAKQNQNWETYACQQWRQDAQVFNHSIKQEIWGGALSLTAKKEHTIVSNATSHLVWLALWKRTCSPIVEWRTTLAQNVVSHLVNQDSWGATWSVIIHTGEKVHECSELFIWSGWTLKKAQAYPRWGETIQMTTMRLCVFTSRHS